MKTRTQLLILLLISLLTLTACKGKKVDPNKVVTEIPVNAVTGIEVHQGIQVKFEQTDDTPKITVTCPKHCAQGLNVRMDGTTLVASYKPKAHVPESGVNIEVKAPGISRIVASSGAIINLGDEYAVNGDVSINCSSAANVKAKKFACQNLYLDASSAAQIQLGNVNCANIQGKSSSCALILLDGNATAATFTESSGSEIRCPKLQCANGVRIQK